LFRGLVGSEMCIRDRPYTVTKENILYKCGWSPFEGTQFPYSIQSTFVNGHLVYHQGQFNEAQKGSRMQFTRS
jgi:dihydroorotase